MLQAHTRTFAYWLVGLLVGLMMAGLGVPPAHIAQAQASDARCFPETGFCISGRIREYWEQNDGLRVFGLPITPQQTELIEGQPLQVQWFERNRLELHPTNNRPYDVLLGRLGYDVLTARGRNWLTFAKDTISSSDCRAFETGFNVCGPFLAAWQANGLQLDDNPVVSAAESLALFGLPISPAQTEVIEGQPYLVQWFERARFELHPQNPPPFNVLFGLLGNDLQPRNGPMLEGRIAFLGPNGDETVGGNSIFTINPDGSRRQAVTTPQPEPHEFQEWFIIFDYNWSRNGRTIAFAATGVWECGMRFCRSEPNIYTVGGDGRNQTRLTDSGLHDKVALAPDGSRVAFTNYSEEPQRIYLSNLDGSQRRVLSFTGIELNFIGNLSFAPDGSRLAFTALPRPTANVEEYALYVFHIETGKLVRIHERLGSNMAQLAWSPDGTMLAFTSDVNVGDLYLVNADGTGLTKLFHRNQLTYGPIWSPDGMRLLMYGQQFNQRTDQMENVILLIQADGSEVAVLVDGFESISSVDWSPDGQRIVFGGLAPDTVGENLFVLTLANPVPVRITEDLPDGSYRQVRWRLPE